MMQSSRYWTVHAVSPETLSRHVDDILGINSSMYYDNVANTFVPYHTEDKQLSFIFHISTDHSQARYVVPRALKLTF